MNSYALANAVAQPLQTAGGHADSFVFELTVFVLAVFVGYYVVWRVTPALHSPLISVTNAISSVIIVGALIAAGPAGFSFAKAMGFVAVTLAAVNIFGGFIVTQRILQMFKKKQKEGRRDEREPCRLPLSDRLDLLHHGAARSLGARDGASRQHVRHRRHGDRRRDVAADAARRQLLDHHPRPPHRRRNRHLYRAEDPDDGAAAA